MSYSDDGQTVNYPALQGGQIVLRFVGGTMDEKRCEDKNTNHNEYDSSNLENLCVADSVKVLMNFGIGSLVTKSEANVNEFLELDILEHQKNYSIVSGTINSRIGVHLRPQLDLRKVMIVIRNPLEELEIDISGSLVEFTVKEGTSPRLPIGVSQQDQSITCNEDDTPTLMDSILTQIRAMHPCGKTWLPHKHITIVQHTIYIKIKSH